MMTEEKAKLSRALFTDSYNDHHIVKKMLWKRDDLIAVIKRLVEAEGTFLEYNGI